MSRKVYRYGCLPPTHGANLVAAQLRAAHDYQGDLVTIERLRRAAIRLVDACPEVAAAEDALKAATKSDRKAAESALREARKAQRSTRWARAMLGLIKRWDRRVRKELYAWTPTFWGTKLDVGARHEQARKAPLYGDDAIEPSDPKRRHWNAPPDNGTRVGRLPEVEDGQVGIQIQGGMATEDAASGTMARLEILPLPPGATSKRAQQRQHGLLSIRVGSDGRAPVWATWPILYHRPIPHTASWKWVRVSVRHVGRHARWSAEITVDDAAPRPRDLDRNLTGTLFVEWAWEAVDGGGLRVARWTDDRGGAGEVVLPARIAKGIRIPDGHRAVRDIVFNELRPKLQAELQRAKTVPGWLREAGATLHLWRSPVRLHALHRRWAAEPTIAPAAYTLLDGWVRTDRHLWDYEAGVRRGTLAQRRAFYERIALDWSMCYRTAVLSDQDLSREASFGPDSDRRQTAGCFALRLCCRNVFGLDALDGRYRREKPAKPVHCHGATCEDAEEERECVCECDGCSPQIPAQWCERARDEWMAGGARRDAIAAERKENTTNAWAKRKAAKGARKAAERAAREAAANAAE